MPEAQSFTVTNFDNDQPFLSLQYQAGAIYQPCGFLGWSSQKYKILKIACLWRFWDFRDTFPKTPGYVLWWKTNLKQVLQPVPWVSETNFWWSKARFIKITQKAEIFIFCHCLHGMARKAIRNDTGNKIKLIWGARVEKLWKSVFLGFLRW